MRMRRTLAAMLAWAAAAQAQPAADAAQQERLGLEAARRSAVELGCPPAPPAADGRTDMTAHSSGLMTALLHFTVPGCARQNVLVMQAPNQPLRAMAMLPGSTAADPTLQRDALRPALGLAAARLNNCNAPRITDTRITQPGRIAQGRIVSAWTEEWVASGCGATTRIQVTLTPSAQGGTDYRLRPAP